MEPITLDHVRQAAEWAKKAVEPTPIDGQVRKYNQGNWDCGTSCCMWGAASIIAGQGPASTGPSDEWAGQDTQHLGAAALMRSGMSTPDQMLAFLRGADLSGANLRGADLSSADLSGANLSGANLRSADLSGANLSGADLRSADLRSANLRSADLSGANLSGADLSSADLSGANLSGADLRSANLSGADLRSALVKIGNVYRKLSQE